MEKIIVKKKRHKGKRHRRSRSISDEIYKHRKSMYQTETFLLKFWKLFGVALILGALFFGVYLILQFF